jgi:hypothetical protein
MNSTTAPEPLILAGSVPSSAPTTPGRPADPFQALDDLMVVLEALCPRWPARPPTTAMTDMRL